MAAPRRCRIIQPHYTLQLTPVQTTFSASAEYRAEVNSPDMNGRTPIMIAAGQNHSDTVEILEQAGSRMEARDYWCETAHEHVANMWLRLGRPAEEERDLQTEEFFRVLGKALEENEIEDATHFRVIRDHHRMKKLEKNTIKWKIRTYLTCTTLRMSV